MATASGPYESSIAPPIANLHLSLSADLAGGGEEASAALTQFNLCARTTDRLDSAAILTMHSHLLSGQHGWEERAGRHREQMVWVGAAAVTPIGATYIAPQHERVPAAMDDIVAFVRRDDLPVVVQAAVAHAQFESVHPFVDGNGARSPAIRTPGVSRPWASSPGGA